MNRAMIPTLTVAQMREVDRIMVEDLKIELIQMMENVGRTLAQHTRRVFLGGDARGRRVIVLAGGGGNGGGGIAAARRLANWGAQVSIAAGSERRPSSTTLVPATRVDGKRPSWTLAGVWSSLPS